MHGVENRFKMQLLLGLKGSPLVGATILNFVAPDLCHVRKVGATAAPKKVELAILRGFKHLDCAS